ncbi:TolC family protein [Mangrovimicrobium sediminis]|uniref:TolC family protein n=1 Tax=Mangrovimicrobium sediminis TaxID=2562682 RepID=A0A4Z0M7F0_9GAMM|nr:TolC family protein [Haliea sp. SAOS-164]TGD75326.1 TolC family protein [Haliea sp. SAOS-164]
MERFCSALSLALLVSAGASAGAREGGGEGVGNRAFDNGIASALAAPVTRGSALELSLDDAVAFALRANHRYLNLVDQVAASDLDYEAAQTVYKTHFGSSLSSDARLGAEVGSSYSLFMDKRNESGSRYGLGFYNSTFGDNTLSEWRLSYTLPFFRNPLDSQRLAIFQAEINAARSRRLAQIGRDELANQVVAAYLRLAMSMQAELLTAEEYAIAETFLARQRVRQRNGEVSALELSEAQLNTIDARQAQDQAALERSSQEDSFRLLLGMDPHRELSIDGEVLGEVPEPLVAQPLAELETGALTRRAEVQAKKEELLMLGRRIESTRVGVIPPLEVSLHYSLVGEGDGLEDSFSVDDQRFGVGLRMDTDLQNSEVRIRQRQLQLQRAALQREYDYLQRSLVAEVRKAYHKAQRAHSFLDYLQQFLAVAEQKHEQAEVLYQRGEVTELELFQSHHQVSQANHRILSARVDYLLAEQSLALAAGVLRY